MNLRSRIEQLEMETPGLITLFFDDGTWRSFPGMNTLEFCMQAQREFRSGGGTAFDAVMRAVDARNCGKMWQLMRGAWIPLLEAHGIATPASPPEAAPIKSFKPTLPEDCPKN